MQWLEAMPFELRLQIYEEFCRCTPVLVHNIDYPQGCKYLKEAAGRRRAASAVSLLLTCKAVRSEFESLFYQQTNFTAHFETHGSCFQYQLPGNEKETTLHFFKQQESKPLHGFFAPEHVQFHLGGGRYGHESTTPSFMKTTFDHFRINEPVGCLRYPVSRAQQAAELIQLLHFCRGRVRKTEFWWHPVRWEPQEAAIPWRITVDIDLNFTIRGPSEIGFIAMRKRFSNAIWLYWPRRNWNRRHAGTSRRAVAQIPCPQFQFIEDHTNTRLDHTVKCCKRLQKRFRKNCNCGDPGHYGGAYDVAGTEGQ